MAARSRRQGHGIRTCRVWSHAHGAKTTEGGGPARRRRGRLALVRSWVCASTRGAVYGTTQWHTHTDGLRIRDAERHGTRKPESSTVRSTAVVRCRTGRARSDAGASLTRPTYESGLVCPRYVRHSTHTEHTSETHVIVNVRAQTRASERESRPRRASRCNGVLRLGIARLYSTQYGFTDVREVVRHSDLRTESERQSADV